MTFKNKDFNLNSFYASEFQEHLQVSQDTLEAVRSPFEDLLKHCVKAIESGNKILFFGNGGSAADAQHLATELVVRDRVPVPSLNY